jgi:molybdenum cofactor biosynthesis enzyme MoaA
MSGIVSVDELVETFRAWHHKVLPDRLRVVGGEPLLHPELETILPELHHYWPNARIDLLTNGLLFPKKPKTLQLEAIWKLSLT